jgi:predicted aconitase
MRAKAQSMQDPSTVPKVTGPLLVFGGPYSNLEATEAILAEARRRDVPAGNIVCTGDLVAYCADPQGVIDLLRCSGIRIVMGNCEEALAAEGVDCGCGFAEDSACAALSTQWYSYAAQNVDAESRLWMGSLPRRLVPRSRLLAGSSNDPLRAIQARVVLPPRRSRRGSY